MSGAGPGVTFLSAQFRHLLDTNLPNHLQICQIHQFAGQTQRVEVFVDIRESVNVESGPWHLQLSVPIALQMQ